MVEPSGAAPDSDVVFVEEPRFEDGAVPRMDVAPADGQRARGAEAEGR